MDALKKDGVFVIVTQNLSSPVIEFFINNKQKYFYTEYTEVGHVIWAESNNNPLLIQWFLLNRKTQQKVKKRYRR